MASSNQTPDPPKYTLPADFLSGPASNLVIQKIDWSKTPLPEYAGLYATIIDNALSEAECTALIRAAEAHSGGMWKQAMVNVGGGKQRMITEVRDCGRIIWDDEKIVDKLWARISKSVPELDLIETAPRITGHGPAKRNETYKLTRLNERMRFLKYCSGQYFRPHQDGSYITPSGDERSFYTLHLYLNDAQSSEGVSLRGGATTFHSWDTEDRLDVVPKIGRVLLFQHRGLVHSGNDVEQGIKVTMRTDIMYARV